MDRTNNFQHEWFNQTTLHPVGMAALAVFVVMAIVLPRRWAFLPVVLASCFISEAQRIALGGIDLTIMRILVIVLFIRVMARGEQKGFRLQPIDKAVIAWTLVSSIIYVLREASLGAIVYKFGKAVDYTGVYFLFRVMIRSWQDADRMIRTFVVMSVPLAIAFIVEKSSGLNSFSIFGGVPQYTVVRMGKLRCQGPYPHAIMAGCFWVSMLPLIAPAWWRGGKNRLWTLVGLTGAFVVIITCTSSTPLLGVVFSLLAVAFFPLRRSLQPIRWAALLLAVVVHFSMKSGIWFLIARIDAVGGSTGFHRAFLIDQAVHRFPEWALLGTSSTGHWGFNLVDVTNQYILEGVRGGFLSMVLFVVVLGMSFQCVGKMVRHNRKNRARQYAAWGLGAAMFAHCWMFLAVSYFGHIWVVWYLTLAMIGSLSAAPARKRVRRRAPRSERPEPRKSSALAPALVG